MKYLKLLIYENKRFVPLCIILGTISVCSFGTFYYATLDDTIYRAIAEGDFNQYIGHDNHVNFSSYIYINFLIYLMSTFKLTYAWDLVSYLILTVNILFILYLISKIDDIYTKSIFLVLIVLHFPLYFVAFHLTKLSGLLLVSYFIFFAFQLFLNKEKKSRIFILVTVFLFTILISSLLRLKAQLLFIPIVFFSLVPVIFLTKNKRFNLIFFIGSILIIVLISSQLWNLNVNHYAKSPLWKNFYEYNDIRYQLMEYNTLRDTIKYREILPHLVSKLPNDKKLRERFLLENYQYYRLDYYDSNELFKEIRKYIPHFDLDTYPAFVDSFSYNEGRGLLAAMAQDLKREQVSSNPKVFKREIKEYSYLKNIDNEFKKADLTFNDYVIMEHWWLFDNEVFTLDRIKLVAENLDLTKLPNISLERIKYSMKYFFHIFNDIFKHRTLNFISLCGVLVLGLMQALRYNNRKFFFYSTYLCFLIIFYNIFMENSVKNLPNWVMFPIFTYLYVLILIVPFFFSKKKYVLLSNSSKQGFYFLFLIFFILNLLSYSNVFNTSKKINQYKYQITNGFYERSEYLKDKIIVHVAGAIPSNSWCYPFQECDLRKKYRSWLGKSNGS